MYVYVYALLCKVFGCIDYYCFLNVVRVPVALVPYPA